VLLTALTQRLTLSQQPNNPTTQNSKLVSVCTPLKIGLYGGTFDPIHHGHLILARQVKEELGLNELVFVPAAENPFKQHGTAASHRLEMVRLALESESGFSLDPNEVQRGGISYSYNTAANYKKNYPEAELYFLIGEDNARDLQKWHRFADLDKIVRFVVMSRSDAIFPTGYPVIRRHFDISATEIRNRVANGLSITYLVPEKVVTYIEDNKLYRGKLLSTLRS
jgi:nicotinate-nucleotide adenylyltransferase